MLYFWGSAAVLAALLYLPVTRLVWALSVRRLERRRGAPLDMAEIRGQGIRARFLGVLISAATALLFNLQMLGWPPYG